MPYWSLYLKSINMSAEAIGILSAVVVATKIFSSFIWGWVVDHTGKRMQVVRLTSLLSAISFSLVLFYQDFWSLFIILFIFAIFWSAALPQIEAATLSHLGEMSNSYTIIRIWGSISFIVAVLVLGQYFDHNPIAYLLPMLIGSMVLVWIHTLFIPEISSEQEKTNGISFRSILLKPHVISLMAVCFLIQAGHGPYYTFFSIYLEEHGYSNSFIGMTWAIGALAEVLIYVVMHRPNPR